MSGSRIQGVSPKEYKGVKYRSTLEADTAKVLDLMGIPFEYETRKFTLLEGFHCPFQKNKVIAITYKPDFIIGNILIECKGFETPEWKNKKKYLFKYLMEKEPNLFFHQIKDCGKQLLEALDTHWISLGYAIQVTSKGTKRKPPETRLFDSLAQAMEQLNLKGKALGSIKRSLTGEKEFVYGYNWKIVKLSI